MADFKTANPTLLNDDNSNKHVYFKIQLASGYEFAASGVKAEGEILLPFASVIANIGAPTIKPSLTPGQYTSRVFVIEQPTSNVSYKFRINSVGP